MDISEDALAPAAAAIRAAFPRIEVAPLVADFTQPIVTVCLGDAADWMIGGPARADKATACRVNSGDALVMGPPARMLFHGVRRIHAGTSPIAELTGRYSLTFRKAL